uniref:Uncharacterized protein n=1 Tax=Myoviridae sp. ctLYR7 TaxID=2827679 RepID=A0A8S5RXA1_9CAUD|nr:MAG TPA: hypothetical protein [Myoviridae sp. ctLYR7]
MMSKHSPVSQNPHGAFSPRADFFRSAIRR